MSQHIINNGHVARQINLSGGEQTLTTRDPDTMSTGAKMAEGIAIIIAREPDAEACATNDELFFGAATKQALKAYTKEERARLKALGWRESEDSWAIFT